MRATAGANREARSTLSRVRGQRLATLLCSADRAGSCPLLGAHQSLLRQAQVACRS